MPTPAPPLPPRHAPPRVGVVTVTYNSAKVLPAFLDCMGAQTWPDHLLFAIDNASSDDSAAHLRRAAGPRLRIIANSDNRGVAAANNQGIAASLAAGCDYVLLLNNDVEFLPGMIADLARGALRTNAALAAPKILYYDPPNSIWCAGGDFQPWQANGIFHHGYNQIDRGQCDRERWVGYAPTCCLLVHARVFATIGTMDERFFVYYDDVDFCLRARNAGFRILALPSVPLWHKVSSLTGGDSSFSYNICTRNKAYFIRKHYAPPMAAFWLGAYRVGLAARRWLGLDSAATATIKRQAFAKGRRL